MSGNPEDFARMFDDEAPKRSRNGRIFVKRNRFQKDSSNIRTMLRKSLERLASTHRGCRTARGCKCLIDRTMTIIENAERDLFALELEGFSEVGDEGREHCAELSAEATARPEGA